MRTSRIELVPILLVLAVLTMTEASQAQIRSTLADPTVEQLNAIDAAKAKRTPAQKKISTQLLNVIHLDAGIAQVEGAGHLNDSSVASVEKQDSSVIVKIRGQISSEQFKSFIASVGGSVTAVLPENHLMTATVPIKKIEVIASRPEVNSIVASRRPMLNASAINAEGDIAHSAAVTRQKYQADGKGVKVCVLSDSVTGLVKAQAAGSLGEIDIPIGEDGQNLKHVSGEGTAMLEIIHRIAPAASLGFATAYKSDVSMAVNIRKLANSGCTVIVDDVTYPDESPFQDGVIAEAVSAVSAKGVLYFSSAANSGNVSLNQSGTWEGDFHAAANEITLNEKKWFVLQFSPGNNQNLVTDAENPNIATLFWNDPLGHASNEYDLYVIDEAGDVIQYSDSNVDVSGDPIQSVPIEKGQYILVLQHPGSQNRFLHLDANRSRLKIGTRGSTRGHNASGAENAFTVAAVSGQGKTTAFLDAVGLHVEDFSSDGPRRIFYDHNGNLLTPGNYTHTGGQELKKPDITAADCVTTDVMGFETFCGTSAAAPQAAAIAALLKSKYGGLGATAIRRLLTSTTINLGHAGWNDTSGYGIVMADAAFAAAAASSFAAAPPHPKTD